MLYARFGHQAWGFLSFGVSACVSVHVKIDKPEKTRSTHPNAQELRKHHSIRLKPGIEDRSLYFCCILIRILRSFSAQQQLSSGTGGPKTPSQMVFLTFRQKCVFTHILPCKIGLAEVCKSKNLIQNGWNRVSGGPEPLKITTSKTLVFCVPFEPRNKNCIFARKIRRKTFVFEVCV